MVDELRAGVASVPLDPPLGVPMMGYGAREGVARGTHDPLHARALYLANDSDLLWVECDWCLVAPQQAGAVRARIEERVGLPADRILLGSIHTHSGPDTGFGALLSGKEPAPFVARLLDAAVEAGAAAVRGARPARLGIGHAEARIGRNRRRADGPLDPDVLVLRVDDCADGRPLAVLYVHGCHPTALGHDNLLYSADWPAAAGAAITERFPGALPMFALGAHADVDPRTRGLQDLAIAGQSAGVSAAEVEALGREVGEVVADAAEALAPAPDVPIACATRRVPIPAHRETDSVRREALRALELPESSRPRVAELYAMEQERTAHLPAAERRERISRVRAYLRDRTAHRFAFAEEPEVEVQVLRVGEARLLALPLEPTVDVGLDWKQRIGSVDAMVLGIANGWMRYLPHEKNFEEPEAHLKYEILQSTLVPEASTRLLDAAERLAGELPA